MKEKAVITDIQRYSMHDGPGIRTMVFFKGCPLHCLWCHNPETHSPLPQIMVNMELCIGCGACLNVCPEGAIHALEGRIATDYSKCRACGACSEVCYAGAREISGKWYTVEEVKEAVMRDVDFYRHTGGGVTLSGGEVLMQADFAAELLKELKQEKIHTAIETCGYASWKQFEKLVPYLDLALYDVKHSDSEKHEYYTGKKNDLILDNLKKLSDAGVEVIVRVPLIPGVNDAKETVCTIAQIGKNVRAKEVHLLPFHQIGTSKWDAAGKEYKFRNVPEPERKDVETLAKIAEEAVGITVRVGGN